VRVVADDVKSREDDEQLNRLVGVSTRGAEMGSIGKRMRPATDVEGHAMQPKRRSLAEMFGLRRKKKA